ncbi:hypothetical protein ScPMuIL_006766 [Solemya velum]
MPASRKRKESIEGHAFGNKQRMLGVRSSERLQKLHDHVHVKPDEFAKNCMTKGIDQNGFSVMWINEIKGYGVFADKKFKNCDFLLEYVGDNISFKEAKKKRRNICCQ